MTAMHPVVPENLTVDVLQRRVRNFRGCSMSDRMVENHVRLLLNHELTSCSDAWASEMLALFQFPDPGSLQARRDLIRTVRVVVSE